ncbi:unnamed protein product [Linum trigynum]|uniref:Legume lectin domain-containing protein n=1 Tax=Linum trigynum TaxID=586398 RepID=A0AAV2D9R5_9ROSI
MLVADFTNNSSSPLMLASTTLMVTASLSTSNLDYQIPIGRTGSVMGLALNNMSLKSSSNPFVAIEFDTFANEWDVPHVGIDINSAISVKTARWMATSWMDVD